MRNNWTVWIIVLGVVAVILFVFNFQAKKDMVPVNHILPEGEVGQSTPIEYEFVDQAAEDAQLAIQETASGVAATSGVTAKAKAVGQPGVSTVKSPTAKAPGGSDLAKGKYTIQVMAAKNKVGIEAEVKKMSQQGHPAYMVTKDLGEKGVWYRIYVGSFSTKAEADQYLAKIKAAHKNAFVVSVKN